MEEAREDIAIVLRAFIKWPVRRLANILELTPRHAILASVLRKP